MGTEPGTPTAMVLLGTGLIGLAGFRRKNQEIDIHQLKRDKGRTTI